MFVTVKISASCQISRIRRIGNVVLAAQVGRCSAGTLLFIALTFVVSGALQAPAEVGVPNDETRPPELRKLDDMIGVWDVSGVYRASPNAPLFNGQGTDTVFWSPNKRAVISERHELSPYGWIDS